MCSDSDAVFISEPVTEPEPVSSTVPKSLFESIAIALVVCTVDPAYGLCVSMALPVSLLD